METSVPKGVATTIELKPQKSKPNKKAKEVKGEKEYTKRADIETRLEALGTERTKHKESIAEDEEKLKGFQENYDLSISENKKKVEELLEDHFTGATTGGLMDKVLQTEVKTPKLNQLQDSIGKLKTKVDWHKGYVRKLNLEEASLKKQLAEHDIKSVAWKTTKGFDALVKGVGDLQPIYDELRGNLAKLIQLSDEAGAKKAWPQRLFDLKMPEWEIVCLDTQLRPHNDAHVLTFLHRVGRWNYFGQNPFRVEDTTVRSGNKKPFRERDTVFGMQDNRITQ